MHGDVKELKYSTMNCESLYSKELSGRLHTPAATVRRKERGFHYIS